MCGAGAGPPLRRSESGSSVNGLVIRTCKIEMEVHYEKYCISQEDSVFR